MLRVHTKLVYSFDEINLEGLQIENFELVI